MCLRRSATALGRLNLAAVCSALNPYWLQRFTDIYLNRLYEVKPRRSVQSAQSIAMVYRVLNPYWLQRLTNIYRLYVVASITVVYRGLNPYWLQRFKNMYIVQIIRGRIYNSGVQSTKPVLVAKVNKYVQIIHVGSIAVVYRAINPY